MLRAGIGMSGAADPREAARDAARSALACAGLERAEAALVLATPEQAELAPELLAVAAAELRTPALAGASISGILRGEEGGPGVAIAALAGVEARPFLVEDPAEIAAQLAPAPRAGDLVVVLPDSDAHAGSDLAEVLAKELGPAAVAGVGAAAGASSPPLQWCGRSAATGAVAGLVLRGLASPRLGLTQACRPATPLLQVTRTRGHWVLELEGRPALDVFREVARGPLGRDLRRAAEFVLVALPRGAGRLEAGDYVVRPLAGFDAARGAFALAERIGPGDELALALREPEAARDDLKAMLAASARPRAALALYFACRARGRALFGVDGLEAGYLESALAPVPALGVLGPMQIGPVAGRPETLTHAGVLVLLEGLAT